MASGLHGPVVTGFDPLPLPTWEAGTPPAPWESGLVEGWVRARLLGLYDGDHLGEDLVAFDPDGDGRDDLAVAAVGDSTAFREAGAVYVLPGVRRPL